VSTNHSGLLSRIRGWLDRRTRIQKLLAAVAGLIITIGAVASAVTAILDLADRFAARNKGEVSAPAPGSPAEEGVRVIGVIPDSPADHAGVRVKDIITTVRGRSVEDVDDFRNTLKQVRTGNSILLSLLRDSHREYVSVKLQRIEGSNLRLGLQVEDLRREEGLTAPTPSPVDRLVSLLTMMLVIVIASAVAVFWLKNRDRREDRENSNPS